MAALTSREQRVLHATGEHPHHRTALTPAGTRSGSGWRQVTAGISDSITRSVGGNLFSSPVRRNSRSSPLRWYSASGPRNARNRFG